MIEFTQEELDIIRGERLPESKKPEYYDSSTDTTKKITEEFESYLILQKIAQKAQVLVRLKANIKNIADNTDRDEVIRKMAENITANSQKMISDLDLVTAGYTEFRQSVFDSDRRFDGLNELNRLMYVIRKPIDELIFMRDNAFQDVNASQVITDVLDSEGISERTKKELESWQKVVSSYRGQI